MTIRTTITRHSHSGRKAAGENTPGMTIAATLTKYRQAGEKSYIRTDRYSFATDCGRENQNFAS